MKKLIALVLALVMVLAVAAASAVTITVNRDSSYAGSGDRAYNYYKVFSATYSSNSSTTANGASASADGTPLAVTGTATSVAYTATPAVAAILGDIDSTTHAWTTNAENLWFDLKYIPSTGNYSVTWRSTATNNAATVQAAATWLIANSAYESGKNGSLDWDSANNKWTKTNLEAGYYVIDSNTSGLNLIAATTDITVNEKNAYPSVDKQEKDEDDVSMGDGPVDVAVGDTVDYDVIVYVPGDADQDIVVIDTMSAGLKKYLVSNSFNITVAAASTKTGTYETLAASSGDPAVTNWVADTTINAATTGENALKWKMTIKPTVNTKNKWIKFSFKADITSAALTDTGKKNDVQITYGNNVQTDTVPYKTYYDGIIKKAETANGDALPGVTFVLREGSNYFPVTKTGDYYVYDGTIAATEANATVTTDTDGMIIIRGLDKDKTYTLTEKETITGYNLLDKVIELNPVEDTITDSTSFKTTATITANYEIVINKQGTLLPSTGGIGTTIFYVLGGLLVVGAAVILVARRKASN